MLSVCIPLKNRIDNLLQCVYALDKLTGIDEIVIGDFHSTDTNFDWVKQLKTPTKVIDIDGEFSIGRAKNVAAENSHGDILFFLDADVITPQSVIDKILKLVPQDFVYCPIMWFEDDKEGDRWAVSSHGQIALSRTKWENHKWQEWLSYGGEDDLFFEPYIKYAIVDLAQGFIHKWHSNVVRTENYSKPPNSDLEEYNLKTYGIKNF